LLIFIRRGLTFSSGAAARLGSRCLGLAAALGAGSGFGRSGSFVCGCFGRPAGFLFGGRFCCGEQRVCGFFQLGGFGFRCGHCGSFLFGFGGGLAGSLIRLGGF